MANLDYPIDEFLGTSRIMIVNASDPAIQPELAKFGYDAQRIQSIKSLYEEVENLQAVQKKEFSDQLAATAEVKTLWGEMREVYIKTLKIARVAFKNQPEIGVALELYGERKQSLNGWLGQVRVLYKNLIDNPSRMALMAQYGYTPEKIEQEFRLCQRLADLNARQLNEMGEAQAATRIRDKALDQLASEISDLRAVAKVALASDPQQLEKLGILARSEGSSPRKKPAGEEPKDTE